MKRSTRILLASSCWRCSTAARAFAQQPPPPPRSRDHGVRPGGSSTPRPARSRANQVILVEGERIKAVGPNLAIPPGAAVIDLSELTVLPGSWTRTRTWR